MKKIVLSITILSVIVFSSLANTLNLSVVGMHCGGCESKFKNVASQVKGITEVKEVSAANSSAVLNYDASVTSEATIIEQLAKNTGYTIKAVNNVSTSSTTTKPCCKSGQTSSTCTKTSTPSTCTKSEATTSSTCTKSASTCTKKKK